MQLTLGKKLLSGFLFVSILLMVVTFMSVSTTKDVQSGYEQVVQVNQKLVILVWELRADQMEKIADIRAYMLYKDPKYMKDYESVNQHQDETFNAIENLDKSEQTKSYLAELRENDNKYDEGCQQIAAAVKAGDMPKAMQLAATVKEFAGTFQTISGEWEEAVDKTSNEAIARTESEAQTGETITYTVAAVAIIASVLLGLFLSRSISKPVNALSQAAAELSKGNLTVAVPEVKTKDEVEGLAKAFGVMVQNLRELIRSINETAESVASTSEQLSSNTDETAKATEQVANAIQEIARGSAEQVNYVNNTMTTVGEVNRAIQQIASGAQEQAHNIMTTAEMVNQMAQSIQDVAASAQTVALTAGKTKAAAGNGGTAVKQTIVGMEDIKNKVYESANKIKELGEHSQQIGEIIQVIDDIAEQTNLLALNAAIEAARAGEHGKGFAVVADEVRKLAERSGKATKEIAELITNIQKLTDSAVKAMDEGTGQVEQGSGLAIVAGNALKEILATVEETYTQVQNISAAAEQISASSQEVVRAIDNVSAITEENTAATEQLTAASHQVGSSIEGVASVTEEASAASEEVSASTEEMTASVEAISVATVHLAEMAADLRKLVARFTV